MNKLFKYELKRILLSKFYFGMLAVVSIYSYYLLCGEVILGIGFTAPFSAWSYGWYLAQSMPVLLIALLFFLSAMFTKKEKSVRILFNATSVSPLRYLFMRCMAALSAYMLLTVVTILMNLIFNSVLFKYASFSEYLLPTVIVIVPTTLLIFGIGLTAGSFHIGAVYVLILIMLFSHQIPVLSDLDIFGSRFLAEYPKTLAVEPIFSISAMFALERLLYAVAGCAFIFFGSRQTLKHIAK